MTKSFSKITGGLATTLIASLIFSSQSAGEGSSKTEILKALAPGNFLPEHSERKRSIDLDITFKTGSSVIDDSATSQLNALAESLSSKYLSDENVTITGHTDSTGSEDYNLRLSLARADAVRAYLTDTFGHKLSRFTVRGMGETSLKDPINSASATNRRVQISIEESTLSKGSRRAVTE